MELRKCFVFLSFLTISFVNAEPRDSIASSECYDSPDEKVYLNPRSISIRADDTYFQKRSGEEVRLHALFSDGEGCYVPRSSNVATVYPLINCKNCGFLFSPTFYNKGKRPQCDFQN